MEVQEEEGGNKESSSEKMNQRTDDKRALGIGTPKGIKGGGGGGGSTIAQVTRESKRIPLIPTCQKAHSYLE